jgi:hypothetical protein
MVIRKILIGVLLEFTLEEIGGRIIELRRI